MTEELLVPRELLESVIDEEDCWFDHQGGCQAHGALSLEPGDKCPQAELKALLRSEIRTKTIPPPIAPDCRPIEVQVRDASTGEVLDGTEIENDYNIVCAGTCYVEQFDVHEDGTHVLTIRGRRS